MKKNVQITTEVLDIGEKKMTIRTCLIVIRENGLRSSHKEVKPVRHFRNWQRESKALDDRLIRLVKQWIDTGIAHADLDVFELE